MSTSIFNLSIKKGDVSIGKIDIKKSKRLQQTKNQCHSLKVSTIILSNQSYSLKVSAIIPSTPIVFK